MTKTLIALALAGVLIGCSSGSDNDNSTPADDAAAPVNTGSDDADTAGVVTPPPATGGTPTADSKAGVWLGDFGTGSNGVYIIDNDNRISGLAVAADGSANSVFGSLGEADTFTGTLDNHTHPASNPAVPGVFAPRGEIAGPVSYSLNILDGQTIESTDAGGVSLSFAAPETLSPATAESLTGAWQGSHSFCSGADCSVVAVNLTFSGADMSGNTEIVNVSTQEVSDFSPAIAGTVAPFGDVMTTSFSWNDLAFSGVVYFDTAGNLILNADDISGGDEHQTLSSLLTRP